MERSLKKKYSMYNEKITSALRANKLEKLKKFISKNPSANHSVVQNKLNSSMDSKVLTTAKKAISEKENKSKTPFSYRPQIFSIDRIRPSIHTLTRRIDYPLQSKLNDLSNEDVYSDKRYMNKINDPFTETATLKSLQKEDNKNLKLISINEENYKDDMTVMNIKNSVKNLPKIKNSNADLINSYFDMLPKNKSKNTKFYLRHTIEIAKFSDSYSKEEPISIVKDYGYYTQTGF
jgi:hypothetical protein